VGFRQSRDHFLADVSHNMGIFFSKEAIWTKSPQYDGRMVSFPPDIRRKYQSVGGALEHYADVVKKNPAFPMAHYFRGNVYNDWGSQEQQKALEARAKGDMNEAQRLRTKSNDLWDKSEEAYNATRKLAPNYVQTHHQVGLLFLKRAEAAQAWGEMEQSRAYYETAYQNFERYRMLDPVFPPNYERMAQILVLKGKTRDAIELMKQGIYYNDVVAKSINKTGYPDRVSSLASGAARLAFNEASNKHKDPFKPVSPEIQEAIQYFRIASEANPKNEEAWKGLAFLLEKSGQPEEARKAVMKMREAMTPPPGAQPLPTAG
jgi:tetratricopeptide (TPR) repeat protein